MPIEQFLSTPRFRPAVAGAWPDHAALAERSALTGTRYTIKRALESGGPYEFLVELEEAASFTDTGLENGVSYYYVIQQHDLMGESADSRRCSRRRRRRRSCRMRRSG